MIIISIVGIKATPQKTVGKEPQFYFLPDNSTTMFQYHSDQGGVYGFSYGNQSALILPVLLPTLVLDRGQILQELNLTGVTFTLFSTYDGTDIFSIANVSLASLNPSGSNISGLISSIPLSDFSSNSTVFISDTVGYYVFLGTLSGVERCISVADNGNGLSSPPAQMNVTSKLSIYSKMNSSSTVSAVSLNSSGNLTTIRATFKTPESLTMFRAEFLALELSNTISGAGLSVKNLTAIVTFKMDLYQFSEFVSHNSNLMSSLVGS